MLLRDGEGVERREVSRFAPRFKVELRADAPDEFRLVALGGKNGSGGAGSLMPSSLNRCSALAGREPSLVTICLRALRHLRAIFHP